MPWRHGRDDQHDERHGARQDEPRRGRLEVGRVIRVPKRKPDLRQDERDAEERGGAQPGSPPHEWDDWHKPDQKLRRKHLPERDEGDERGRARRQELRRRGAAPGADRREADPCLPPCLATPRERDGQRNEYGGEELRRDRRAEYSAAETQPSRDERRKRRDDERGRPEVVTAQ